MADRELAEKYGFSVGSNGYILRNGEWERPSDGAAVDSGQPGDGLQKVGEYSTYPEFRCRQCGEQLWTECSQRTGWREWLITKDGKHHFKTRCNVGGER